MHSASSWRRSSAPSSVTSFEEEMATRQDGCCSCHATAHQGPGSRSLRTPPRLNPGRTVRIHAAKGPRSDRCCRSGKESGESASIRPISRHLTSVWRGLPRIAPDRRGARRPDERGSGPGRVAVGWLVVARAELVGLDARLAHAPPEHPANLGQGLRAAPDQHEDQDDDQDEQQVLHAMDGTPRRRAILPGCRTISRCSCTGRARRRTTSGQATR